MEMLEDRVRFLLQIFKTYQERGTDRNVTAIGILTTRLFRLLPDSSKVQFLKEASSDPVKLKPLRDAMEPATLLQLRENSSIEWQKMDSLFNNLLQNPSTKNFKDLVNSFNH